ncbi:hypothetical protein [Inhella crocodyli]|uniref:ABC-type transport auxiliary lipoprotein component domain-containing protein n=1 Tax=Inhella crocodyli TaxID=2499851 RepID=A0A437LH78_9BURK|nr:hypothetical protein [Inhella crocodyli]RVT84737.1 hypothetical protein EOD73_11440 [Inhella crocodyli]
MSVNRRRLVLLLPALAALGACSAPVRSPAPVGVRQVLQWQSWVDPKLQGQIALGQVTGGDAPATGMLKKTLAWFWGTPADTAVLSDGLEDQLRALSLLAALPGQGRFALDAKLLQLDAGGLVLGAEAQSQVLYTLREGDKVVYQRRVRAQAQTGWGDHVLGSDRQRLAKEAAIKESLRLLALDLVTLRV